MRSLGAALGSVRLLLAKNVSPLKRPAWHWVNFRFPKPLAIDLTRLLMSQLPDVYAFAGGQFAFLPATLSQFSIPAIPPCPVSTDHCFDGCPRTFEVDTWF